MENNRHLPIEWYIATLKFIDRELSKLPRYTFGNHKGKRVVRYLSENSSNPHRYYEIFPGSSHYKKYAEIAARRANLTDYRRTLMRDWNKFFKMPYDAIKDDYEIIPVDNPKYSYSHWKNLPNMACSMASKKNYPFDGNAYKSRFESTVAQQAYLMHLPYKYDVPINTGRITRFADFAFGLPAFNLCIFAELFGMMDDPGYKKDYVQKSQEYADIGLIVGRDLFILAANGDYMPSPETIQEWLIYMVESACARCVRRIR